MERESRKTQEQSMSEKKRKANLSKIIAYLERLQIDIEAGKL